jgi:6,7-dimethyl-8-ribityllumazine synthase
MSDEHAPGDGSFNHRSVTARRGSTNDVAGWRVGIVTARFNAGITDALYAAAVDVLLEAGIPAGAIVPVTVPGAVEVPLAIQHLIEHRNVRAVVALGCVIRGESAHFDYVCDTVTQGCLRVSLDTGVPVGFGVITAENVEQAEARKVAVGEDAAKAALELAGLVATR